MAGLVKGISEGESGSSIERVRTVTEEMFELKSGSRVGVVTALQAYPSNTSGVEQAGFLLTVRENAHFGTSQQECVTKVHT